MFAPPVVELRSESNSSSMKAGLRTIHWTRLGNGHPERSPFKSESSADIPVGTLGANCRRMASPNACKSAGRFALPVVD